MELQFEKKPCRYLQRNVREVKDQEQTQEVKLPEGMPDIGTILGTWGQCVMRSKEWHEDGMNVAGGVMAWVLYTPEDGSQPQSVDAWIPFQMKCGIISPVFVLLEHSTKEFLHIQNQFL